MADGVEESAAEGDEVEDDREPDETPKLKNKEYMKELRRLQAELCDLQEWVKKTGERIIVIFEGGSVTPGLPTTWGRLKSNYR